VKVFTTSHVNNQANQFMVKDERYAGDSSAHPGDEPPVYTWGRIYNPVDKKPYIIDFDDLQPALTGVVEPKRALSGVVINSVPGGGTVGTIRFYPDGHCSDPAGAANIIVLGHDGDMKTISVDAITGRVEVQ
jgi:hypothetical protein